MEEDHAGVLGEQLLVVRVAHLKGQVHGLQLRKVVHVDGVGPQYDGALALAVGAQAGADVQHVGAVADAPAVHGTVVEDLDLAVGVVLHHSVDLDGVGVFSGVAGQVDADVVAVHQHGLLAVDGVDVGDDGLGRRVLGRHGGVGRGLLLGGVEDHAAGVFGEQRVVVRVAHFEGEVHFLDLFIGGGLHLVGPDDDGGLALAVGAQAGADVHHVGGGADVPAVDGALVEDLDLAVGVVLRHGVDVDGVGALAQLAGEVDLDAVPVEQHQGLAVHGVLFALGHRRDRQGQGQQQQRRQEKLNASVHGVHPFCF